MVGWSSGLLVFILIYGWSSGLQVYILHKVGVVVYRSFLIYGLSSYMSLFWYMVGIMLYRSLFWLVGVGLLIVFVSFLKRSFRFRKKRSFLKTTHSFSTFRKRKAIVFLKMICDRFLYFVFKNNRFLKKRSFLKKNFIDNYVNMLSLTKGRR